MSIGTEMKIQQIMQMSLVTVKPEDSIVAVAQLMDYEEVGTVLVVSPEDKLLGMITDRQITIKVVANELNPETTYAKDIMTRWPMSIFPDTTCKEALSIMGNYGYRRLPVESDGKLVGIVSLSDLAPVVEIDESCIQDMVNELSNDVRYR